MEAPIHPRCERRESHIEQKVLDQIANEAVDDSAVASAKMKLHTNGKRSHQDGDGAGRGHDLSSNNELCFSSTTFPTWLC
jgi:hypothetical protein